MTNATYFGDVDYVVEAQASLTEGANYPLQQGIFNRLYIVDDNGVHHTVKIKKVLRTRESDKVTLQKCCEEGRPMSKYYAN